MNKLSILTLFWIFSYSTQAQTELSGVINQYAVVTDIIVGNCSVELTIDDPSAFLIGDKIVLMKMQGAQIENSNNASFGNISAMNSTGMYEVNEIMTIDGNTLTLRYQLINDYTINIGKLQVIRMPVYDNAEVVGTLTANAWNGATGGVVALEVTGQLLMNGSIDVSGLGFRGGVAKTAASNNCTWAFQQDDYYYDTDNWRGSAKGEGIAEYISGREHGRGAQANGGGGGNDHNSGGGGGGNASAGGEGGENDEPTTFGCKGRNPGIGGKSITDVADRLFLGGGGGAGHENNEVATDGAAGGGIVILIVNEFYPVGFSIFANGASALDGGGDGGGGGGAGGTILLDVQTITSVINMEAIGGDGSRIDNGNFERCHGPGGGGSGGRIITNLMVSDPFSATLIGGVAGQSVNSASCNDGTNDAQDGAGGVFELMGSVVLSEESFPFPIADFDFVTTNEEVDFSNTSIDANSYTWDFGDMNSAETTNPSHTYTESGTYTVQLIATNACGSDTLTQEVIIMIDAAPAVAFVADTEIGCAPMTINYMDISVGNVDTYLWTFEGGQPASSTLANPQVTYATPGMYDVQLEVSGPGGTDLVLMENFIEILLEASANFAYTINDATVNFTNQSANALSYTWDFGDMNSAGTTNPSHTYTESGTYTVQLIATNACGSDTLNQEVIIMIDAAPAVAFTADTEIGCAPMTINYMDVSVGNVDTYLWTFEGGQPASSTLPNPQVTYTTTGMYDVQLEVSGPGGTDLVLMENFIEILPEASANFTYTINGATVDFTNQSTNALSYTWDFGDMETDIGTNPSHVYAESGTYEVRLIAMNPCGTDTIFESIEVEVLEALSAAFTLDDGSGCAPWIVNFDDFSTGQVEDYLWTFEGGTPATSTEAAPQVIYENPGTYDVRLEVSGPQGSDEILIEDQVVIAPSVVTSFGYNVVESEVTFINNSSNAATYQWDFGDGSPLSNEENPVHTYSAPGTYTVTLLASSDLCGTVSTEVVFLDFVKVWDLEDASIKIYPNPAMEMVHIEMENNLASTLRVLTIEGKDVLGFQRDFMNSLDLDVKTLATGVYIILVEQEGQIYRERLVKF